MDQYIQVYNNLARVLCCKLVEEEQKVEKWKCDLSEDVIKEHVRFSIFFIVLLNRLKNWEQKQMIKIFWKE